MKLNTFTIQALFRRAKNNFVKAVAKHPKNEISVRNPANHLAILKVEASKIRLRVLDSAIKKCLKP